MLTQTLSLTAGGRCSEQRLGLLEETELAAQDRRRPDVCPRELRVWAIMQAGCERHTHTRWTEAATTWRMSPGHDHSLHEERSAGERPALGRPVGSLIGHTH